jgi:tight adherence protein C
MLGSKLTVHDFRVEQVVWGVAGAIAGAILGIGLNAGQGRGSVLAVLLLSLTGVFGGVLGRDWRLTAQVRHREERMLAELPVIAELLALAVTAGEAPAAALTRVCGICQGEVARELQEALSEVRSGASLPAALDQIAERTSLAPLARFLDGIVIALERGTPLADVLRAQAGDAREAGKRALLTTGGRREVAMMLPVVFLILPITVVFALYPGLINISILTR